MRILQSLCFLLASMPVLGSALSDDIAPNHRDTIQAWLNTHSDYRLAGSEDCRCDDDIESIRRGPGGAWEPEPSYQPYAAPGDFDGDALQDLAVVALPLEGNGKVFVLVSFGAKGVSPEAIQIPKHEHSVVGLALFSRAPPATGRNRRWRLLFGPFESEAEEIVVTRRASPSKR